MQMGGQMDWLVTTGWLTDGFASRDADVRIADVRWYLFERDKTGRKEYSCGHIPGANREWRMANGARRIPVSHVPRAIRHARSKDIEV
jgi:3-mercaptopyruvate sulfurtransferase SseA